MMWTVKPRVNPQAQGARMTRRLISQKSAASSYEWRMRKNRVYSWLWAARKKVLTLKFLIPNL